MVSIRVSVFMFVYVCGCIGAITYVDCLCPSLFSSKICNTHILQLALSLVLSFRLQNNLYCVGWGVKRLLSCLPVGLAERNCFQLMSRLRRPADGPQNGEAALGP